MKKTLVKPFPDIQNLIHAGKNIQRTHRIVCTYTYATLDKRELCSALRGDPIFRDVETAGAMGVGVIIGVYHEGSSTRG